MRLNSAWVAAIGVARFEGFRFSVFGFRKGFAMGVRGKFRLSEITQVDYNQEARKLKFTAVCNDGTEENAKFHKYTPSGEIWMTVDNPSALAQFELGKQYYVDFTPAS